MKKALPDDLRPASVAVRLRARQDEEDLRADIVRGLDAVEPYLQP